MKVQQVLRIRRIEVFPDTALRFLPSTLKEGVERPIQRGFACTVWTVNQQMTAFQLKRELAEGFEVGDGNVI